jgi:hypothetical protein
MIDHSNDPDVTQLLGFVQSTLDGLFAGNGFKLDVIKIPGAIAAGKRLGAKEGAGRYVAARIFSDLVNDHPEMVDLAFQGLSEVAKNKLRSLLQARPVKDAEKA